MGQRAERARRAKAPGYVETFQPGKTGIPHSSGFDGPICGARTGFAMP